MVKEIYTNEQWNEIHERDKKDAERFVKMIKESKDKYVRYKGGKRPVTSIKDMLEQSNSLFGDRTAIMVKDELDKPFRHITYKELKEDVDALGTALYYNGFRGAKVAVIGDNGYGFAISYLSIIAGNMTVVPLDKELQTDEIENLAKESEIEAVFYTKKLVPVFEEIHRGGNTKLKMFINLDNEELKDFEVSIKSMLDIGREKLAEGDTSYLDAMISSNDDAAILFTSGTTGKSKGVVLTHRNLCAQLIFPAQMIKIDQEDRFFSVLPMHHTYEATAGFLIPLYHGASIAYCSGLKYIAKQIGEASPTVFLVVPLILENFYKKIWQNIRKEGKEKLFKKVMKINSKTMDIKINIGKVFFKKIVNMLGGRLRILICGGASLDPEVLGFFEHFGVTPIQGYGLTECAPISALNPDCRLGILESAGYVFPPFGVKIEDEDEFGIGDIYLKGPQIMKGYYNNPEATNEVLIKGWFKTGDCGYVKDGFVFITGRKKSVIITKTGKNVFPEDIELKLCESPLIEEIMVFADDKKSGDDVIICANIYCDKEYISENNLDQEKVKNLLWEFVDEYNSKVPVYKNVRALYLREKAFIKTTGQKIKRFEEENKEGEKF